MKTIILLLLLVVSLTPANARARDYNLEYNNLELEFGLVYNYHPYLDNINEDIKGENAYLNDNKAGMFNLSATNKPFRKLEYSLAYQAQLRYYLLDFLAIGSGLERICLSSSYLIESNDGQDNYYLQSYNLSSSALLLLINLSPFRERKNDLADKAFWERLIIDFNLAGGIYYHQFVRSYDLDMYYNNFHYQYNKEDKYDGFSPGFKGGVELSYLINQSSSLTLGAKYNKISAKRLTDEAGKGYRSIYSDDFQAEEFDFSNYGLYLNLVFKL